MKLACELPDEARRSLSLWTCAELARSLTTEGIVEAISPQTVQRLLAAYKLKPWRVHYWLSPKAPRDAAFRATVLEILDLYTRPLERHEQVLSLDEKTSLQPRTRTVPTRPAQPGGGPVHVEHEYQRKGALQLFAAFNTRTGKVTGILRRRKRQVEVHHGKLARAWLAKHPRFRMHFTPAHCSWMNQVEQWFSILQRRRLVAPNFEDLAVLEQRVLAFIAQWNDHAHPFGWSERSFTKILTKVDAKLAEAA